MSALHRRSPRKHSTRSIRVRTQAYSLPAIFGSSDITPLIFQYVSWTTLINLSNSNSLFRMPVHWFLHSIVAFFVGQFFPLDDDDSAKDVARFFELLHLSGAVIWGGVARCIMADPCANQVFQSNPPRAMDIVIPANPDVKGARMQRFLKGVGYDPIWTDGMVAFYPVHGTLERTHKMIHKVRSFFSTLTATDSDLSMKLTGLTINLLVCKTTAILPVILRSPYTADFCAMSSTRLYSFYPRLTSRGTNMRTRCFSRGLECKSTYLLGTRTYRTTEDWMEDCGDACPILARLTRNLPGIGVARWGGWDGNFDLDGNEVSQSDGFESSSLLWRVGSRCLNENCGNFG